MFPEQLKKILNLIKKTGDRVVIFDANAPDDSYVVMDFNSYAQADGSGIGDRERVDTISPKLAENISASVSDFTEPSVDSSSESGDKNNLTGGGLTDKINHEISMWKNREDFSSSELKNKQKSEDDGRKKGWQIPSQVKDKAQEID